MDLKKKLKKSKKPTKQTNKSTLRKPNKTFGIVEWPRFWLKRDFEGPRVV